MRSAVGIPCLQAGEDVKIWEIDVPGFRRSQPQRLVDFGPKINRRPRVLTVFFHDVPTLWES
jgi:hypothetical protein